MVQFFYEQLASSLCFFSLGHINVGSDHTQELAGRGKTWMGASVEDAVTLICVEIAGFQGEHGTLLYSGGDLSNYSSFILRVQRTGKVEFRSLLLGNAPKLTKYLVEMDALSIRVTDPNHHRSMFGHKAKALLGRAKLYISLLRRRDVMGHAD